MTSQFHFLTTEWPEVAQSAQRAEAAVHGDPRTACFYARRTLELMMAWLYKHDASLSLPYQDNLSALVHDAGFRKVAGEAVFYKARAIKDLGNQAVHSTKPVRVFDALMAVKELFHLGFWLARHYARGVKPDDALKFDQNLLPQTVAVPKQTLDQLQRAEADLRAKDEDLKAVLADKESLDEELVRLRAEIAAAKQANDAKPDEHDYSEAETRDYFIDLYLKEAGWAIDQARDREFEVTGMPNAKGNGFVDYVLWGDDGKPLALVEAKRTRRDARVGQQQAKLYADCLERMFGQRPIIFYSNGYEHWLWDDACAAPRAVQGFFKKAELELMIQRRQSRKPLSLAAINRNVAGRYYQERSIRRIGDAFEKDHLRKALVVMATGSGKTRTVIALADVLMRCNWAKRVLFLADRVALVNQALNAFKAHLPEASPVNLVTEKDVEGRVFVSTYPTMMGLIDDTKDGQRRFGVGHFDLIIIDEAHRSVFQKYRAIFDYFDALLVGLTATPKDEVDRNTYGLFDLEDGVPTDAYSLDEAVGDKFLVPPKAVSVPLKFQREGIRYDDLSEVEKEEWDAKEWDEDGEVPDRVEAEAVNKWLFNADTVDKVLAHVMERGLKVAGGDRLGKTIIFAKNNDHAEFIADRFNKNYPHYRGEFARVITFKTEYAQTLIDNFYVKDKAPHIAISVDMLDTGIDVPEVVNLVFFKLVRSKTKFWQMIGRGTRLCPDLFGMDQGKEFFFVFDYCQNLEFFAQNPDTTDGNVAEPLGKRLFKARLELIGEMDKKIDGVLREGPHPEADLRRDLASLLRTEVTAMNLDNFIVRPKRKLVEKYREVNAWDVLRTNEFTELAHDVAGLPSEIDPEDEEAKRFDLLVLNLQLALLRAQPAFARLCKQVKEIAGLLEEKASIPMVREQLPLILDLQTDDYWQDITAPLLETMRKRLRALVKLIEKKQRKPIFTNFEDELGNETTVELPGFAGDSFAKFRDKARVFLRAHQDHLTIHKLRMNEPLTALDLQELERIMAESSDLNTIHLTAAKKEGLGLFVRSLVGLDRGAAKRALDDFIAGKTLNANQHEFVNMIVDQLTEHGAMSADLLYDSPFVDVSPQGPEGLFTQSDVDKLVSVLTLVRSRAVA